MRILGRKKSDKGKDKENQAQFETVTVPQKTKGKRPRSKSQPEERPKNTNEHHHSITKKLVDTFRRGNSRLGGDVSSSTITPQENATYILANEGLDPLFEALLTVCGVSELDKIKIRRNPSAGKMDLITAYNTMEESVCSGNLVIHLFDT